MIRHRQLDDLVDLSLFFFTLRNKIPWNASYSLWFARTSNASYFPIVRCFSNMKSWALPVPSRSSLSVGLLAGCKWSSALLLEPSLQSTVGPYFPGTLPTGCDVPLSYLATSSALFSVMSPDMLLLQTLQILCCVSQRLHYTSLACDV